MGSAIVKISKRAKQIQRKHPGKAWQTCITEASSEYNRGKLGKARTTTRPKKKARKASKKRVGRVMVHKTAESLAFHKRMIKNNLEEKLGRLYVRCTNARTKTEKRKINKEIAAVKKSLRRYQ